MSFYSLEVERNNWEIGLLSVPDVAVVSGPDLHIDVVMMSKRLYRRRHEQKQ